MSNIDINRVQQNIKELQDQNAIDLQHWEQLKQDIEKIRETIELNNKNLNILLKKINSEIKSLKEKTNIV